MCGLEMGVQKRSDQHNTNYIRWLEIEIPCLKDIYNYPNRYTICRAKKNPNYFSYKISYLSKDQVFIHTQASILENLLEIVKQRPLEGNIMIRKITLNLQVLVLRADKLFNP